MPNMTLIQTVTVGAGGAANIEFTSIPATYTDLVVKISPRIDNTNGTTYIDYNSSTSNQSWRRLYNSSGSVGSDDSTRQLMYSVTSDFTASTFGNTEIYIPNYASSNNKSSSVDTVQENNSTSNNQALIANLWSSSAAITAIRIVPLSGNFVQYSTAYLYGVTSAPTSAKATGGTITSDGAYFYHTFTSSGTFTPTQALTADYLVVAGGGGGGCERGGGGGAGGLRSTVTLTGGGGTLETPLSLTAQAYSITVGAGGTGAGYGTATRGANGNNSVFSTITSTGGGGGGSRGASQQPAGGTGGSGGGACSQFENDAPYSGGSGTANQGYAGGNGVKSNVANGGGGGGAGEAGIAGDTGRVGIGGNGVSVAMDNGAQTYYAGGGGGGAHSNVGGLGGLGGGGQGGNGTDPYPSTAPSGTANTGGGGGGGWASGNGGNGGSGIVVIRYAI